ncbi:MAG: hypothetical protein GYA33_03550 [Thermogutta sp.]|nr:hypothetical protein [Thermogutta sp.]
MRCPREPPASPQGVRVQERRTIRPDLPGRTLWPAVDRDDRAPHFNGSGENG